MVVEAQEPQIDYNEEYDLEAGYSKAQKSEKIVTRILLFCASFATIIVFFIIFFLFQQTGAFFTQVNVLEFLFSIDWSPTYQPETYGAATLIIGTFITTLGAMIIAVPLGVACAIFIAELAPPKMRTFLKGTVEILAGIPSVVYGFFGLIVLVNWIRVGFNVPFGESWLAGSILLGIMALPTIISVSEDAISSVPREFKEGSLAMGATKWQTIKKVTVPAATSGITAAIILGMGRAIGETMAIMMVCGNIAELPDPWWNLLSQITTITAVIATEMGEVPQGSTFQGALFALAIVLFFIVFIITIIANVILNRLRNKFNPEFQKKKLKKKTLNGGENTRGIYYWFKEHKKDVLLGTLLIFFNLLFLLWWGPIILIILIILQIGINILGKKLSVRIKEKIAFGMITSSIFVVIGALVIIIGYIAAWGSRVISIEFLTEFPRNMGTEGGIMPTIIGTLFLVLGAIAFSVPIGVLAGIYLSEYTKEGRFTRIIRFGLDSLNGTPSIVFGLFGFAIFVRAFGWGKCLLAGQITLALMILPTIVRTTEEALISVPQDIREGSLAMGATKWQSISRVAIPAAMPGIITGVILGMGRSAGETAPIMFTAVTFQQRFLPRSLFYPVMALPYHIYAVSKVAMGELSDIYAYAAGTALVLLVLVLLFYSIAIIIRNRYEKKLKW